jgi:N-glycosylase/DNA lyase
MKRALLILMAGLAGAMLAYSALYYASTRTCRMMKHESAPELAWLKAEFHLADAEFRAVCEKHEAYMAGCMERCRLIDEKNQRLKHLLAASNSVSPEIEKTLADAALLRAQCQKEMLQHFYDVSRTMPPDQGKRYLAWVQDQTILADSHSQMHH